MPLEEIRKFHGHIGPYAVLGYRMGEIACEKLGNDPFGKSARALTGTKTPLSCLVDGVQLSSGCTLGKGNIEVREIGEPQVIFVNNDGGYLMITVKPEVHEKIQKEMTKENAENMAQCLLDIPDEELFDIDETRK